MSCAGFRARLHPYVDGELGAVETAAADTHRAACWPCADLVGRERNFRALLRRQPRDLAPPELRVTLQLELAREQRRRARRFPGVPVITGAVAAAIVLALLPAAWPEPSLIAELVDGHGVFAEIDQPAELASSDAQDVTEWFLQRAGMHVSVPDYSPASIRLVGGRLAEARARPAAYLLYAKGGTMLSVFLVSLPDAERELHGAATAYRGETYTTYERNGFRAVAWAEGQTLFGLVSMLDYDALLVCADRLKATRARRMPL